MDDIQDLIARCTRYANDEDENGSPILAETLRRCAAALSNPRFPQGWQPIESAPKDVERLILSEAGRSFYGSWVSTPFQEYRDSDGFYVGQVDPQAYWMDHETGDEVDPTHWQPLADLPPPPEQGGKG